MGTEKSGFSKPLFSVPIGFSVIPWCRMHLFPKYLRKIRLGRESDGLCNLGDRQIAVRQKFLCLIDPPVDQITDRRYSFIACKSMNHIIFIHICQLTQGILTELPKRCDKQENIDSAELDDLMPWLSELPDECRKPRRS